MSNVIEKSGNIFNTKCQTIVNTVNCEGVMGKGIALVFACRYSKYTHPKMLESYINACKTDKLEHKLQPGKLLLYKTQCWQEDPWVLHFPTKNLWKLESKIEYIEDGLKKFVATYKDKNIESIAFPLLGTANGGLQENVVIQLMHEYLTKCDIPVEIWHYDPAVPDELFIKFKNIWLENRSLISNVMQCHSELNIQTSRINNITELLMGNKICNIIDLIKTPNIGVVTVSKCFAIAKKLNCQEESNRLMF